MRKYEILEHKADLKIRVFGKTKKDLFKNAFRGMVEKMKPEIDDLTKIIKRKIYVRSLDLNALLVDFLSEVLSFGQMHKETYFKVEILKITDENIEAVISGKKVRRFGEEIKAVTHHDLSIQKKKDGTFEAVILFDI